MQTSKLQNNLASLLNNSPSHQIKLLLVKAVHQHLAARKFQAWEQAPSANADPVVTAEKPNSRMGADTFQQLVEDYKHQAGWGTERDLLDSDQPHAGQNNLGSSGITGNIRRSQARAAVMRQVAKDIGADPEQMSNLAYRAAQLPKLVQRIRERFPGDKTVDERLALADFSHKESPADETARQQRQADDARILAGIQARLSTSVPQLAGLQVARDAVNSGRRALAPERHDGRGVFQLLPAPVRTQLEKLLGHRIITVDHPNGVPFNGYKVSGQKVILLAKDAQAPILSVAMHEGLHALQTSHPELYKQLVSDLKPLMQNTEKYRAGLSRLKEMNQENGRVGDDEMHAELIADFLGDQATKPEFWDGMATRNPQLFKRVARQVKAMLDKVLDFIRGKGIKDYGAEQYFKDMEQARNIVSDALNRFAKDNVLEQAGIPREAETFERGAAQPHEDWQASRKENSGQGNKSDQGSERGALFRAELQSEGASGRPYESLPPRIDLDSLTKRKGYEDGGFIVLPKSATPSDFPNLKNSF